MSSDSANPNTAHRQELVADHFRGRIATGELPPGDRLPTHAELIDTFNVSGVTVQRAISRLVREGFIETKGRLGTFVASNPPHLTHYGLVFVGEPKRGQRYHQMLEVEAHRVQQSQDRRVSVFHGLTGRPDDELCHHLIDEVRSHRMAGLLLVDADTLDSTDLLDTPDIYRVAIMSCEVDTLNCPIVYPDMLSMMDLGLKALLEAGRRKIAILTTAPVYEKWHKNLRKAITATGLTLPDAWLQIVPHDLPEASRNNIRLLMQTEENRPDGLFILDDNLSEGASAGLVGAGIRVPDDLTVVAHCNFPWLVPSVLPIRRVGFDIAMILDRAMAANESMRRGEEPPALISIPAVFEDQLVTHD